MTLARESTRHVVRQRTAMADAHATLRYIAEGLTPGSDLRAIDATVGVFRFQRLEALGSEVRALEALERLPEESRTWNEFGWASRPDVLCLSQLFMELNWTSYSSTRLIADLWAGGAGTEPEYMGSDSTRRQPDSIAVDQAWFWTQEWQAKEAEADDDFINGRSHVSDSFEEFLAELDT